jgi:hypothetical protein
MFQKKERNCNCELPNSFRQNAITKHAHKGRFCRHRGRNSLSAVLLKNIWHLCMTAGFFLPSYLPSYAVIASRLGQQFSRFWCPSRPTDICQIPNYFRQVESDFRRRVKND